MAAASVGVAQAQLGDVGETTGVDTDYTPRAKPSERWAWYAGAKYQAAGPSPADVPDGSATPFELDFFDVAFREIDREDATATDMGFAAGAECRERVPGGAGAAEAQAHVAGCERVPVIYGYTIDDVGEAVWAEAYRSPAAGYVGAVAWIDQDRALAVGGTGRYPRREAQPSSVESDGAGAGRAWLFEGGDWRELELPDSARGFTALDVSPRASDCEGAVSFCAAAGGFRQLWTIEDGAFTDVVTDQSDDDALDRAELFQFRVRDVRFVRPLPEAANLVGDVKAVALTSGCCAADALRNGPTALVYDGARWHVRRRGGDASNSFDEQASGQPPRPIDDAWSKAFKERYPSVIFSLGDYEQVRDRAERLCASGSTCGDTIWEHGVSGPGVPFPLVPPLEPLLGPWPLKDKTPRDPQNPAEAQTDPLQDTAEDVYREQYQEQHRQLDRATTPYGGELYGPDSFYGLTPLGSGGRAAPFTAVVSAGGPAPEAAAGAAAVPAEPASHVVGATVSLDRGLNVNYAAEAYELRANADKALSSLRLNAIDSTPVGMSAQTFQGGFEAVGALRSSGQGAAFGPRERNPDRVKEFHNCDTAVQPPEDCDANAERGLAAQGSLNLYRLPSYALNSVAVIDELTGSGWAVGDHGAILQLAGESGAQALAREPEPPRLGAREQGKLPDTAPYDGYRAAPTTEPGTVPPLGLGELERLPEPRFVAAGTPEPAPFRSPEVQSIVMGGDGSEGWALVDGSTSALFYRFDGLSWQLCDMHGVAGVSEPDPACSALQPLRDAKVELNDMARVPLERDADPSNDDELEIVAVGNLYRGRPAVVRYRDGRWALDETWMDQVRKASGFTASPLADIAFTAPGEAWAVLGRPDSNPDRLLHLSGGDWVMCNARGFDRERCDDPDGRLPTAFPQGLESVGTGGSWNRRGLRLEVAGERVYAFGTRNIGTNTQPIRYPMIIYRDHGGKWTDGAGAGGDGGGYDPGYYAGTANRELIVDPPAVPVFGSLVDPYTGYVAGTVDDAARGETESAEGRLYTLSVSRAEDGRYEGFAVGEFGGVGPDAQTVMLRLEDSRWRAWTRRDAGDDYLRVQAPANAPDQRLQVTLPGALGGHGSFLFSGGLVDGFPALAFNPGNRGEEAESTPSSAAETGRWEALATPFVSDAAIPRGPWKGRVQAAAPDNRGGLWLAVDQIGTCSPGCNNGVTFYRYSDRQPRAAFEDVANPVGGQEITALAAGGDGSVWLGTSSDTLHRYDRVAGWDRVRVPGWDRGRVVTRPSKTLAVAVAPDGRGVAVGEGGRIADIGPGGASINSAAGVVCDLAAPIPPCGTGRHLRAAAVAPDGSALTAGQGLPSLLWRPAGGEFRHIEPPRLPRDTTFTALSLPTAERAYLLVNGNRIYSGTLAGERWSWRLELDAQRDPAARDGAGKPLRLNGFALDGSGHGYAVGAGGLLLQRVEGAERPWRRLDSGFAHELRTVALPVGGGAGALVGGDRGLVFTLQRERLALARAADSFEPVTAAGVGDNRSVSVALLPGVDGGQLEAWVAFQEQPVQFFGRVPAANALFHYSSDREEPLLQPGGRAEPLPDSAPPRAGELVMAALGKQECHNGTFCSETGGNLAHGAIAKRVTEELIARAKRPGGPRLALFSGDAVDAPGGSETVIAGGWVGLETPLNLNLNHRRWAELVAHRLSDGGLPVLGAIGGHDLSAQAQSCALGRNFCAGTGGASTYLGSGEQARVGRGANLQWRQTMGQVPAPWESEAALAGGGLRFERVSDGLSQPAPEAQVEDPRSGKPAEAKAPGVALTVTSTRRAPAVPARLERGASTHYAFDVAGVDGGSPLARVVVVDTSQGSLAASDAQQEPLEPGGQAAWMERVLCVRPGRTAEGRRCTREPGQRAVVVSNTPTYSYGPGAGTDTQTDATTFETTLFKGNVDAVVSGRLGWNGRYWATAPGLHHPCPGGSYVPDDQAPSGPTAGCTGVEASEVPDPNAAAAQLSDALRGTDVPVPAQLPTAGDATRPIPFVVAASAGGKFGPEGQSSGPASDGFWRGYSIVRLDASGDPRETIVEQRPVLDWVAIRAQERTLRAGQRMTLRGYGREPVGLDQPVRYIDIDSPAVTHRYDLLQADPDEPWLPARDGDGEYMPLDPSVATVDSQTGKLKAGRGRQERTYAIGLLSVGDKAATYPLVFEPAKSFKPRPALSATIRPPSVQPPAVQAPPPIHVLSQPPTQPPATPPPPAQLPTIGELTLPAPPQIPQVAATPTAAPTPAPPPPPTPPPPPSSGAGLPLNLNAPISPISIVPTVIPPTPPPINPAPPGGSAARKEAKQRQAATAKSEEGAKNPAAENGGDLAQGGDTPTGIQMTRRDVDRPAPSFSVRTRSDQPSAWSRGALYGGGLLAMAFVMAAGWLTARPTPRGRPPHQPAPAWATARRRNSRR